MRRADRLFQLVHALRSRRFATGDHLAELLGVSLRTVYWDVADLVRAGVPIRGEAGVGYRLDPGFELPPLTFTSEELEALALGARIVKAWSDADLAAAARSALARIEAVLPPVLREVLLRTALFAPIRWDAGDRIGALGLLRRAITDQRKVRFGYVRADGQPSERTVRPLGLYFWGAKWSLASWCELRGDFRSFRPDRMAEVELLEEAFDGRDGITLGAFLARMEDLAELDGFPVFDGTGAGLGHRC